jgi:hypothetical protein
LSIQLLAVYPDVSPDWAGLPYQGLRAPFLPLLARCSPQQLRGLSWLGGGLPSAVCLKNSGIHVSNLGILASPPAGSVVPEVSLQRLDTVSIFVVANSTIGSLIHYYLHLGDVVSEGTVTC